jgi:hypothetical protein
MDAQILKQPLHTTLNAARFLLFLLPGGTVLFLLALWLMHRQAEQTKE